MDEPVGVRKLSWEMTVYAECPYCDSTDLAIAFASELGIWHSGFEVRALNDDGSGDVDIGADNTLVKMLCRSCSKVFRLDIEEQWESAEEDHLNVRVNFSTSGNPREIVIGTSRYAVYGVESYQPLPFWESDPLLGALPFGEFHLSVTHEASWAKCILVVRPDAFVLTPNDGRPNLERISCSLTTNDREFARHLKDTHERHECVALEALTSPQDVETGLKDLASQRLEDRFLARAAYSIIREVEVMMRTCVWQHLEEAYAEQSRNWWKEILPRNVQSGIEDTAARSGDSHFLQHDPHDYLTTAQIPEILEKKWEHFKGYLPPQKGLLLLMYSLGKIRNDVMHGRPVTASDYEKLLDVAGELVEIFEPLRRSDLE